MNPVVDSGSLNFFSATLQQLGWPAICMAAFTSSRRLQTFMPTPRDFDDSTLWHVSAFERMREETGTSGFARLDGASVLSSTLLAEFGGRKEDLRGADVTEVLAACLRHREPALLLLQHEQLVWPVTIFPAENLYHSPREMCFASDEGLATLKLLAAEPPGVKPLGHWQHERVADPSQYHPIAPFLWDVALGGPRRGLLTEIAGSANYRAVSGSDGSLPVMDGALGAAIQRLRRESTPLREIAQWPGMSAEGAMRLLNAMYMSGHLMVIRTQPSAPRRLGAGAEGLRTRR